MAKRRGSEGILFDEVDGEESEALYRHMRGEEEPAERDPLRRFDREDIEDIASLSS